MAHREGDTGRRVGSALKAFHCFVKTTFGLLLKAVFFFGLWAPGIYALFGVVLYVAYEFDPFDRSVEGILYLVGFGASVLLALILTMRHLVRHRALAEVVKGYRKPVWQKETPPKCPCRPDDEAPPAPRKRRKKSPPPPVDPRDDPYYEKEELRRTFELPKPETPDIYLSELEPDTLIHEYADRFEVYDISGGKRRLAKIEYKYAEDSDKKDRP